MPRIVYSDRGLKRALCDPRVDSLWTVAVISHSWKVRHQSAIACKEFDEQQRLGVVAAHPRRRPHDLQLPHELNQIVLFLGSEFEFQTRLKNSTVSSSVKSRPSWKYGRA